MTRTIHLNDEEAHFLDGRVTNFDPMFGCPIGCIICGEDALRYSGSMGWADFMAVVEGLAEIREKSKVNVLKKKIYPFKRSDPAYYNSMDGIIERTMRDVSRALYQSLHVTPVIVTAGWKPGDNHMQRAFDGIVQDIGSGDLEVTLSYTVKAVGKMIMREYSEFLDEHKELIGKSIDSYSIDKAFLDGSGYVNRLIENIKTLSGTNTLYQVQCIDTYNNQVKALPKEYKKFYHLFDSTFIDRLFNYSVEKAGISMPKIHTRTFQGVGRAITELNLNPAGSVKDKAQTIEKGIDPDQYVPAGSQLVTAAIDADARLFLYQGSASNISSRPTPVRFFEARSEHYKRKGSAEESNTYVMLANLQGRNLLQ